MVLASFLDDQEEFHSYPTLSLSPYSSSSNSNKEDELLQNSLFDFVMDDYDATALIYQILAESESNSNSNSSSNNTINHTSSAISSSSSSISSSSSSLESPFLKKPRTLVASKNFPTNDSIMMENDDDDNEEQGDNNDDVDSTASFSSNLNSNLSSSSSSGSTFMNCESFVTESNCLTFNHILTWPIAQVRNAKEVETLEVFCTVLSDISCVSEVKLKSRPKNEVFVPSNSSHMNSNNKDKNINDNSSLSRPITSAMRKTEPKLARSILIHNTIKRSRQVSDEITALLYQHRYAQQMDLTSFAADSSSWGMDTTADFFQFRNGGEKEEVLEEEEEDAARSAAAAASIYSLVDDDPILIHASE